jgi:hypothetical protein
VTAGCLARPAYDAYVGELVRALPEERRIAGDGWSLHTDRLEFPGTGWRALIGVRRGLTLLVTCPDPARELDVAAWAGEPDETDGVAVIDAGGGDLRLARVPLCGCGDRGCGNAGVQLDRWLPADKLPALVELLQQLPWTETVPDVTNVLHGEGLAAIEDPDQNASVTEGSYLYSPGVARGLPVAPAAPPPPLRRRARVSDGPPEVRGGRPSGGAAPR